MYVQAHIQNSILISQEMYLKKLQTINIRYVYMGDLIGAYLGTEIVIVMKR